MNLPSSSFFRFRFSSRRLSVALSLLTIVCVSLLLDFRGLDWSTGRHPDEFPICRWARKTDTSLYIKERVYPEGFFQMLRLRNLVRRPFRALSRWGEEWRRQPPAREGEVFAEETEPGILWEFRIRRTNAFFAAAASIFVFLTALLVFDRVWIALCAGLLFASHPWSSQDSGEDTSREKQP